MKLSEVELKELEMLSGVQHSIGDIAIILDVNDVELSSAIRNKNSPEFKAFHRGRLMEETKIRQAIFAAAKDGSGPAQQLAVKMIENIKLFQEP